MSKQWTQEEIKLHQSKYPYDTSKTPCKICGLPSNNGFYCSPHIEESRQYREIKRQDWLATMKTLYKYFIPDGDLGIYYEDCRPWRSYHISDASGNTIKEFLDSLAISEIDQDGGDLNNYGFEDASSDIQEVILQSVGLTFDDCYYNEGK